MHEISDSTNASSFNVFSNRIDTYLLMSGYT